MALQTIGIVLAVLAAGYLAFAGYLYATQRQMVFPVWAVEPGEPGWHEAHDGVERLSLETPDGERLLAYWKAPEGPDAPTLVTFHGNGSSPRPHVERFAADPPWRGNGAGLLAIAYRGYPGSSGSPSEEGLIADGIAAVDFVRERLGEDHDVLLHGHSIGTGVAVAVATQRRVAALYLEAPFTSALALAKERYPFIPGFLMRDPFPSDERIRDARTEQIFIVHGSEDEIIAAGMARDLATRTDKAQLLIIEGAGHMSVFGEGDRAFLDFLEKAKDGTPPR